MAKTIWKDSDVVCHFESPGPAPKGDRSVLRIRSSACHGFSLIELLVVITVISILAVLAVPYYSDYLIRSRIQEAVAELSDWRSELENGFFNRGGYGQPEKCFILKSTTSKHFVYECKPLEIVSGLAQAYSLSAKGATGSPMADFEYQLTSRNERKTISVKSGWTLPTAACWAQRRDGSCS